VVAELLTSFRFEALLCLVILINLVVAILETDATVDDMSATPQWIVAMNVILLIIYCAEVIVRLYAYRCCYFKSYWNLLDFVVIGLDLLLHLLRGIIGELPNLSVLRTVRLVRLARAFRILVLFPELYIMVRGLSGTIRTVFWGLLLLGSFIILFSLVAVQMIHPINRDIEYEGCTRCPHAFATVWDSMCTFVQQVVAGDSWGVVTLPVIEAAPWTFFFFLLVLVTINLLVINLILAVVVEKAQEAHSEETRKLVERQAQEKEAQVKKSQNELVKLCYQMDEDKSGNLSLDELLNGYDTDAYFANLLKSMDISRDDIKIIFNIMDQDNSGDIDYAEFVEQLHRLKSQDQHTLLIFIMYYVKELQVMMTAKEGGGKEQKLGGPSCVAKQRVQVDESRDDVAALAALVREAQEACDAQVKRMATISAAFEKLVVQQGASHERDREAQVLQMFGDQPLCEI